MRTRQFTTWTVARPATCLPSRLLLIFFFTIMYPWIVTNFFVIKPTRCTNFTNLFCHETLHVSDSSSVHHQEFIHCTLSNGMSYRFVDIFRAGAYAVYLYDIPLLSVQWINSWWWTDELSETCRVSWQNKFVKLVHLVGFITKKNTSYLCLRLRHQEGFQLNSLNQKVVLSGWDISCRPKE